MPINKEQLEKYADLKIQEKLIKNELEFLAPAILPQVAEFIAENDGTLPGFEGKGKFSVNRKKIWTYSDSVHKLQEELDKKKEEEKQTGEAKYEENQILVFNQDK